MKKRTLKSIVCAVVMMLVLSITACGGSKDGASSSASSTSDSTTVEDTKGSAEVEEADVANEEADAGDEEGYATLEEALSDPELKEEFEAGLDLDSSQEEGMSISYEVSGNEFIYVLKIEDPSLFADDMAEQLQAALDSEEAASIYQLSAEMFDYIIEQEGACTVKVHYLDPDGNIIAEKSFKAN